MNSLNQIILEGNVVRQPEKKTLSNGSTFCEISLAVNRAWKNSEGKYENEVSYFDIDTFGNLADACSKWCPKGRGIRVVGRLKQDRWQDKTGNKFNKIKIMAEHIEFKPMPKKTEDSGPDSATAGNPPLTKKQKLAMLAEAAVAAQQEAEEAVF